MLHRIQSEEYSPAGIFTPQGANPNGYWEEILRFFPIELRQVLAGIQPNLQPRVTEIRLRLNQPLEINLGNESRFISATGAVVEDLKSALFIGANELKRVINSITTGSFYALDEELVQGYLTLPGGHRVGFGGRVLQNAGKIRLVRNISSLNFRIAKEIRGIARPVLPLLWKDGRFQKTMILAPPASGKTTMLREIIREISYGVPGMNLPGLTVGLVDERSEIAGSCQGVAQFDVGPRTDILDACPKKEGVYLLLRSMNPQVIATDEIGQENDWAVLEDIINAGVSFITTAHARNLSEAMFRPGLRRILETGSVERMIILSNRLGVGTVESVKAGISGAEMWG
ncbi:MAG: stage III sporulation protein AA [Firmicutes bacterium]|nr:stage III sporulation protein AA [Bacillota bacterium]